MGGKSQDSYIQNQSGTTVTMTENQAAGAGRGGGADAPGGMPFYEQSRTELKEMLNKRREMAKKLVSILY